MARTPEELPAHVVELLDDLRPEEVATLRTVLSLGPEGVDLLVYMMDLARSAKTLSRFLRWLVVGIVATYATALTFADVIQKAWAQVISLFPKGP